MLLKTKLLGQVYEFRSIREVLAKASEKKSGDSLAGIGATSKLDRVAAKEVLRNLTIADLRNHPAVPYEIDFVTRIIQDDIDETIYEKVKTWTIEALRHWILDEKTTGMDLLLVSKGLTSEVIAAVAKLMSNLDLIYASKKIPVKATCNTTIGGESIFASRLQPNHPVDDPKGANASLLEGLSYGIGDAVLGLNPAIDTVESTSTIWELLMDVKEKYEIPTQTCVLSHVTTQMEALRRGGKADLCFQSLAGSQKACESFGISKEILDEANEMFLKDGSAKGENVMYFETGQGSELSSSSHYEYDQGVMENRCYGLARHYKPFLVNTVVGFMGPEYVYDTKELIRAGLEDVFCGHMHGLPMGCDVCYTNHMPTDQNDIESLAVILASAGCHYIIGVPGGDDIMLMYQSTGYQDIASIREILGKRPIPEFEAWLEKRGIWKDGHLGENAGDSGVFGEDLNMLKQMTPARIGIGRAGTRYQTVPYLNFLADQAAASDAVFAEVTEETLGALGKFGCFEVKSLCSDKIEMLTRPDWGRKLSEKSLREIAANCEKEVDVQIYFGDGLCAPSIQANAEDLFLTLKAGLEEESLTVGTPFFVRYCRVNTTRQIGELLKPKVVCLLIGERPGLLTSESMSAYISYNPSRKMSESDYTVVANISKHGVPPVEAGAHIVEIIQDMIRYKCSGVKLSKKLSDCT